MITFSAVNQAKEERKLIFRIAKIIAPNLIPFAGILFLGWGIFEVAFAYLLETGVAFMVFFIDKWFIDKRTRYPFLWALLQLTFMVFPFGGLIFGWTILIFKTINPPYESNTIMFRDLSGHFAEIDLYWVLIPFFIIEMVAYYVKNGRGRKHKSSSVWYNLKKFLLVHFFVIICAAIYGALPHNTITGLFLIVLFKVVLDYLIESELLMNKLDQLFSKFSTYGLNEDGSVRHEED